MTLWPSGGVRYDVAVKKMAQPGAGSSVSAPSSFRCRVSCIPGRTAAFSSNTQGGSRVPESGPLGSVRGALSNERLYRDPRPNPDGGANISIFSRAAVQRRASVTVAHVRGLFRHLSPRPVTTINVRI